MGKPDKQGSGPAGMADARFSKMYTDPRFQRFPKKNKKVEIDSRFASELQGTVAQRTALAEPGCCRCSSRARSDTAHSLRCYQRRSRVVGGYIK